MADGAIAREEVSRGERGASGRYVPVVVKWSTQRRMDMPRVVVIFGKDT
jgi:hypothetical protein